jgi:hypothetical protein
VLSVVLRGAGAAFVAALFVGVHLDVTATIAVAAAAAAAVERRGLSATSAEKSARFAVMATLAAALLGLAAGLNVTYARAASGGDFGQALAATSAAARDLGDEPGELIGFVVTVCLPLGVAAWVRLELDRRRTERRTSLELTRGAAVGAGVGAVIVFFFVVGPRLADEAVVPSVPGVVVGLAVLFCIVGVGATAAIAIAAASEDLAIWIPTWLFAGGSPPTVEPLLVPPSTAPADAGQGANG